MPRGHGAALLRVELAVDPRRLDRHKVARRGGLRHRGREEERPRELRGTQEPLVHQPERRAVDSEGHRDWLPLHVALVEPERRMR